MIQRTPTRFAFASALTLIIGIFGFSFLSPVSATPPAVSSKITASLEGLTVPPLEALKQSKNTYPWKTNIVGTVFWVGELPTENNPVPNTGSSWDPNWQKTFGGYDDPEVTARHASYRPANFVPKLNPFYVALPYNDCIDYKTTKEEAAKVIPWFKDVFVRQGKSVCHNRWIAIRHKDRTCYAQWSDCGPFLTTDADYVFGDARPTTTKNKGAGIDLAPSVRDYLGFRSGSTCDWRFVEEKDVPDGPWKDYGRNNPFSLAADKKLNSVPSYAAAQGKGNPAKVANTILQSNATKVTSTAKDSAVGATVSAESARLEELRRQRDLWFSQNGLLNRAR